MANAKITSSLVPQADVLEVIAATVDAVAAGAQSFQQIAAAIGKVERQGRYYRLAAETMDLLMNSANQAVLTPYGSALAQASGPERDEHLRRAVLRNPAVKKVLREIDSAGSNGLSRSQIEQIVATQTTASGTTPGRRVSTLRSWLMTAGYVIEKSGQFVAVDVPGEVFVNQADNLGFKSPPLTPFKEKASASTAAAGIITYTVDDIKHERAGLAHQRLIDKMAANIVSLGSAPTQNSSVDLATELTGHPFLFEMKSATTGNYHSQLRRGLSQLYEYAYLQQLPTAVLCLVTEIPPPAGKGWLLNYLVEDRGVHVCWEVSHGKRTFDCHRKSKPLVGPLL